VSKYHVPLLLLTMAIGRGQLSAPMHRVHGPIRFDDAVHLVVGADEFSRHVLVGHVAADMKDWSGIGTEDSIQRLLVLRFDGVIKS
jgi:hypothetical protein